MNILCRVISALVGLVFCVSGFAKAADAAYFSDLMRSYGVEWFGYLAPAVILFEILLGLLLLFQFKPRWTASLSILFTLFVWAVYMYGYFTQGITDCGCFGHLRFLNLPPLGTSIRNGTMCILLSLVVWRGSDQLLWQRWTVLCLVLGLLIGCFVVGFTFPDAAVLHQYARDLRGKTVQELPLGDFVQTSPDSTYMVFAFSYTCPHCIASIGNVEEALHTGVVDKVIGLSVGDSVSAKWFENFYKPTFAIERYEMRDIMKITSSLPVIFLIRNDSVLFTWEGEVPAPYYFRHFRPKKQVEETDK